MIDQFPNAARRSALAIATACFALATTSPIPKYSWATPVQRID